MMKEDVPPAWMWHIDHCLNDWFEMLEAKRANPNDKIDDREIVPLEKNEFRWDDRE